jgi:hypothetical protein
MKRVATVVGICALVAACSGAAQPSRGTYTIAFPSTSAAVATDFIQILVFNLDGEDKGGACEDLITKRLTTPDDLHPAVNPPAPATNICEMLAGKKPVTIPYGEHAVMAIGERKKDEATTTDFLIGCAIMSVGDGNLPLEIPVRLVSVNTPVPATKCGSVGEFCAGSCQ